MASLPKKANVAFDLLASHHGSEFASSYYRDKVIQRPLYLKPTPKDENASAEPTARDIRQRSREAEKLRKRKSPGKPKPLSAKQKRALQIYTIPKDQQRYDIYIPLHKLWCGYMREILSLDKPDKGYGRFIEPRGAGPLLATADYHGALIEVVRSRCVSRVGVKGIVVRDTKSTFEIVTIRNQLKIVPKEHTVFHFEIPLMDEAPVAHSTQAVDDMTKEAALRPLIFELHGSSFEHRAPDRATRRFVLHLPDL